MTFVRTTGRNPTGANVPLPVSGIASFTSTPLAANAVWESPITSYSGNDAAQIAIQSDQAGTFTVEYYMNGVKIPFMGNPTPFDPTIVQSFQAALAVKADSIKIVYTNGPVAQTSFFLELRLGDTIQETLRSMGTPVSSTNLGGTVHSVIEGRTDGTGLYKQATVTTSGVKQGLDVNVTNTSLSNIDADLGAITDPAVTDPTQPGSVIALLKGLLLESISSGTTGTFQALNLVANVAQSIAANSNRKQVIISSVTGTILVAVGYAATATNWSYRLVTNGTLEINEKGAPLSISIFATAASTANVTLIV